MPRSVVQSLSTVVSRRRSCARCVRARSDALARNKVAAMTVPDGLIARARRRRRLLRRFVFPFSDDFPTGHGGGSRTSARRMRTTGGGDNRSKVETYNNNICVRLLQSKYVMIQRVVIRLVRDTMSVASVRRQLRFTSDVDVLCCAV